MFSLRHDFLICFQSTFYFKEFARYLEERERKRYEMERKQRLEQRRAQEKATMQKLQKEQRQKRSSDDGIFIFSSN